MDLVCDELGWGKEEASRAVSCSAAQFAGPPPANPESFLFCMFPHTQSSTPAWPAHTRDMTLAFLLMMEFKLANFSDSVGAGGLLATLTLKDLHIHRHTFTHPHFHGYIKPVDCELCPLSPLERPLSVLSTARVTVHCYPEPHSGTAQLGPATQLPWAQR